MSQPQGLGGPNRLRGRYGGMIVDLDEDALAWAFSCGSDDTGFGCGFHVGQLGRPTGIVEDF